MKFFRVENPTELGRFLSSKANIQRWRVSYLIRCQGIRVNREKNFIRINGPEMRLRTGDNVLIEDPLPNICKRALSAPPAISFRDYAFSPGNTPYDINMARCLDNRPQTIRLHDLGTNSLEYFLKGLAFDPAITNPIRHLIIASHANPEGHLFIRLSLMAAHTIQYEDLEQAVKDKILNINSKLLEPRPRDSNGQTIPPMMIIRGCRIGQNIPFLTKLKEALGNQIVVNAPKHFHIIARFDRPFGWVEYLAYGFQINHPNQFQNRDRIINGFRAQGFTTIDNQQVPARLWQQWIPRQNLNREGNITFRMRVILPINNRGFPINATFRIRRRDYLTRNGSIPLAIDPGNINGRRNALRDYLIRNSPSFRHRYYPEWVRFGYRTVNDFMNGWTWSFEYENTKHLLHYNASRYEYSLILPITNLATNHLYLNFYPTGRQGVLREDLRANDPRFFTSV